ncbi:hypothetical protein [Streptomyces goshikiensis]|uniref:hypothetical protein n=1 Tax=Streptomyces goshikiensis TaxID=1942 RepID=UPI0036B3E154
MLSLFETFQCAVEFFEVLACPVPSGSEVGAASLVSVLAVNGGQGVRHDDSIEAASQRGRPREGIGTVGREAFTGGHEGGRGAWVTSGPAPP